jgi:ATP-dependent helicase/nuclease subunit A
LIDAEPLEDAVWGQRRELGQRAPPVAPRTPVQQAVEALPEWAGRPVGPEPRPPRPLAPSSSGEEAAADPPAAPSLQARAAAERGVLIHRLLERLPELSADEREGAASAWLARSAAHLPPADREEIARAALTVLADPQWAQVFGPDSLAEVPIAATVVGRIIAGTIDRLVLGARRSASSTTRLRGDLRRTYRGSRSLTSARWRLMPRRCARSIPSWGWKRRCSTPRRRG